jgi:hypothetical protein
MPRTGTFGYHVDGGSDPSAVVELFADHAQHEELHPLIVKVESAPPPAGAVKRFLITDRLAFGPLRFPITYVADVLRVEPDRVVTVAGQRPRITVRNDMVLTTVDGRCRADVEITITAPTLLFPYTFRQARAAHRTLADRMREVLSRPVA